MRIDYPNLLETVGTNLPICLWLQKGRKKRKSVTEREKISTSFPLWWLVSFSLPTTSSLQAYRMTVGSTASFSTSSCNLPPSITKKTFEKNLKIPKIPSSRCPVVLPFFLACL